MSSLVASDEDDLYSGYNEYPSAFSTKDIEQDEILQKALRSSFGKRSGVVTSKPSSGLRFGTSSGLREGTGLVLRSVATGASIQESGLTNRPITAVRGAGYTSQRSQTNHVFDPLNQAAKVVPPIAEAKSEDRPEEKIKQMERQIMKLIDESCIAAGKGDARTALERAKEASTKERSIIRVQEQAGLSDMHNIDLTFSVLFNLANQYTANEMYTEALNTLQAITKNRMFHNAYRLKINMGNIYAKLGHLEKAVKMYRMALDQVPNTQKDLRIKIMHNIGIMFVNMSQFTDACSSFEYIMLEKPDFKAGLHAIICYYALDEKQKMKQGFQALLEVPLEIDDEDRYIAPPDDLGASLLVEVIRNDSLRVLERELKREAEESILTAAQLIAPVIEDNFSDGYNWCLEAIGNSVYAPLSGDLEINKAVTYLKQGEVMQAVDTLRAFGKKDAKVASAAAANLSAIHFLQGEIDLAEKSAESARLSDGYNAGAYVNLGNCCQAKGEPDKAKELYLLALENDASCIEALYNLGVVNKQLGLFEDALECFLKLHAIVSTHAPVLYQLAHLYELVGDTDQSIEWFLQLLTLVPTDPNVLQKLGEVFDADNDKQQAYHYHIESYRHYPSNLTVADWLGSYYVELRVPEKAVSLYERASLAQPAKPKWRLLIGSCYRRAGNYQQALNTYKQTHEAFPDNVDCLKLLVRLCTDLGLKEAADYALRLKKVEKARELRERIDSSRSGSRRSSGRSSRSEASPRGDIASPVPRTPSFNSARTAKLFNTEAASDVYLPTQLRDIDAGYSDPLGPMERPRTSYRPPRSAQLEDDFGDEELGDDLLPE